ncbi:PDR/VanB family oxidoreductase [Demequina aurantiaca]|uniref:PDR/VanB family oxidoreductase n=1 Tax=Demequina aurantiaca TaxID=676200 RepID=UPI003D32BF7A
MSQASGPFGVIVVRREETAGGVIVVDLVATTGASLPGWTPGAHVDVVMPAGMVRQYSLCGEPGSDRWRIAVLREDAGRGGSRWLADNAAVGATLTLEGPRNHFELDTGTGPALFLAAGIGVTPLVAMARAARDDGRDYLLRYSGSTRKSMALVEELERMHGERLAVHVSDEASRLDLESELANLEPGTVVYACGPSRYLDAVTSAAVALQMEVRMEHFTPVELTAPVRDDAFEVELAMSGITVQVPPGKSILAAVEEEGILVLSSCTEGTCGTCETPVIEGKVDHRDSILTPAERDRGDVMYVCVSRAACPRLVLDL